MVLWHELCSSCTYRRELPLLSCQCHTVSQLKTLSFIKALTDVNLWAVDITIHHSPILFPLAITFEEKSLHIWIKNNILGPVLTASRFKKLFFFTFIKLEVATKVKKRLFNKSNTSINCQVHSNFKKNNNCFYAAGIIVKCEDSQIRWFTFSCNLCFSFLNTSNKWLCSRTQKYQQACSNKYYAFTCLIWNIHVIETPGKIHLTECSTA